MDLKAIQGATRPLITILFSLAVVLGFFLGRISGDQFLPIAISVVSYWFGSRPASGRDAR